MKQLTHDNHYVPQMYLKQWSDDGINVWAYRILVSHERVPEWERRPIRGIAYQRDLYTSSTDGEEVDDFERWIEEEFEEPVHETIEKVSKNKKLSRLDWERLAKYLGAQDLRTPLDYLETMEHWRNTLPKMMEETLENSVEKIEQLYNRGEKPFKSITGDNQFDNKYINVQIHRPNESGSEQGYIYTTIHTGRGMWIEKQKYLLSNTVNVLLNHKWSIICPAKGFQWFTSDHPVVKLNYYSKERHDLKGGWGNKGTNLLMPITPRHLLFTEIGAENSDQITLKTKQTREFQRFIAERAFRWIYADREMGLIKKLRPRRVDSDGYDKERDQWKKWHEEQSKAEKDFFDHHLDED